MRSVWLLALLGCTALPAEVPAFRATGCATTLAVAPDQLDVYEDSTEGLTAAVTASCGTVVIDSVAVVWTSRNPAVATVVSTGDRTATVTGIAVGVTFVRATWGALADSARVQVTALAPEDTFPCTGSATHICPGDDGQAKIAAQGTSTTFTVGAGTHRFQSWTPKNGDSFIGEAGTVLTGARELTGWTASGSNYYVGGQTQQLTPFASFNCQAAHPGCFYPEQLWVNDRLYEHMTTLAAIGAGKWYFDYGADRIYLPFNPTDSSVATSVTAVAFGGTATGVTIKHLTVERYAGVKPFSVVNASTMASWTIDSNVIRDNNGHAVAIGTNGLLRWNTIIRNGQMGYKAQGDDGLIYGNIIDTNNTAGFGPGPSGETGAGKAARTDGFIFRRNIVSANDGPGPWTDIDNINCTIDSNTVTHNKWRGIFHEISYACAIRYNTVTGNGNAYPAGATQGACDGAGILISSSKNTEVDHNTLSGNRTGICAQETDRTAGPLGSHDLVNLDVHDNTITQTGGQNRAGGATDQDTAVDPYSGAANNVWADNAYTCTGATRWRWTGNLDLTKAAWLLAGQDAGSTFSGC